VFSRSSSICSLEITTIGRPFTARSKCSRWNFSHLEGKWFSVR
jgi:hypothetical protein